MHTKMDNLLYVLSEREIEKPGVFSLEVINEDGDDRVILRYADGKLNAIFEPEEPEVIGIFNPDSGLLDTGTRNGVVSLEWLGDDIVLCAAKYGDGRGGSLDIRIDKTPENMESFMTCLRQWKALYE